jgi:hypothetical protein
MSKSAALVKELSVLGVVGSTGPVSVEQPENGEVHLESGDSVERISALCESISEGFSGFSAAAQELHQQALNLEEMFNSFLGEMEALDEEVGREIAEEDKDEDDEDDEDEEDEEKGKKEKEC